ncbi:MAG: DUF2029 domain-containing protein [Flavobacteriales bacterium]|nr:DUF2029 domain-containing protein [Flavobacteriales bacterium]
MMINDRLLPAWWLMLAATTVVLRLLSDGIIDSGDGIQHYHIARASWKEPLLLLDHWGKPLFTLLSSPFAQLGLWGMTLFNALCLVLTCWAADGLLRAHGGAFRWLFAPLLLLVPEYGRMVLAGMTEPFFGMLTLLTLRALYDERPGWGAAIASFTPFARPEFVAFFPFVGLRLVAGKQWRALPLLLLGSALYAIVGGFALGDPLWNVHRDPYQGAESVYGRGDPLHFVRNLPDSLGWPVLALTIASTLAAAILWRRHHQSHSGLALLGTVAALPTLAIIAVHSFLWWKGLKGSLGLTRVLATAAPLLAIVSLWPISYLLARMLKRPAPRWLIMGALGLIASAISGILFLKSTPLPYPLDGYQHFLRHAGERISTRLDREGSLTYYHPLIAHYSGLGPYAGGRARQCWGPDTASVALGLASHDLLAWDAHFGPNEGGTPLDMLLARADLELLELLVPKERMEVLGGFPFEVWLFRAGSQARSSNRTNFFDLGSTSMNNSALRADTIPCFEVSGARCLNTTEFPFEMMTPTFTGEDALWRGVLIRATFAFTSCDEGRAELVYTENCKEDRLLYWSWPVTQGEQTITFRLPPRSAGTESKLYLWNLNHCAIMVTSFRVEFIDFER